MNCRERFASDFRHDDFRVAFVWNRERREKSERKMLDRGPEFVAIGSIPGKNRIERLEHRRRRAVHDTHQIETGVGDGARPIRETDQRQRRTRSPHFGVISVRRFEFRQRNNHVADRAGPNEKTTQRYFKP